MVAPPPVVTAPAEVVESGSWSFDVGVLGTALIIIAMLGRSSRGRSGP